MTGRTPILRVEDSSDGTKRRNGAPSRHTRRADASGSVSAAVIFPSTAVSSACHLSIY